MFRDFLNGLLNLIYPNHCLLCKRLSLNTEPLILCPSCLDKLEKNPPPFLRKRNYYFERCFSPLRYCGPTEDLIHLLKYRNRPQLAKPLSQIMIRFMEEYNLALKGFDCLLPIPLHPSKLREREYNQSELLSRPVAAAFNIRLCVGNLRRQRFTQPQSSLKQEARWDNVRGAFAVKNPPEFCGKKVLLVDDLLTTGATCNEAARVLKEASAESVDVLTLACAQ